MTSCQIWCSHKCSRANELFQHQNKASVSQWSSKINQTAKPGIPRSPLAKGKRSSRSSTLCAPLKGGSRMSLLSRSTNQISRLSKLHIPTITRSQLQSKTKIARHFSSTETQSCSIKIPKGAIHQRNIRSWVEIAFLFLELRQSIERNMVKRTIQQTKKLRFSSLREAHRV